jgi:hypothetical protein
VWPKKAIFLRGQRRFWGHRRPSWARLIGVMAKFGRLFPFLRSCHEDLVELTLNRMITQEAV